MEWFQLYFHTHKNEVRLLSGLGKKQTNKKTAARYLGVGGDDSRWRLTERKSEFPSLLLVQLKVTVVCHVFRITIYEAIP